MSKSKKKILAVCVTAAMLASCSSSIMAEDTASTAAQTITLTAGPLTAEYKTKDIDTEYDDPEAAVSCGASVEINGSGVSEADGVITISKPGTYVLSGSYTGQLVIEATKDDYVHLVFNGFSITSGEGPAVNAVQCDKLTITLAAGTVNNISDTDNYTFDEADEDKEPDAALFSTDDMSINGTGTLNVTGSYADAIKCKKDLKLIDGTYNITAVSEGIKGRNSVVIKDGAYNITSGGTAIKSTKDDDPEKGYVIVDGGSITINAGNDGIHAETHTTINGGNIYIEKAEEGVEGQMVDITGGDIKITASDDGINASRIGSASNKGGLGGMRGSKSEQTEEAQSTSGEDVTQGRQRPDGEMLQGTAKGNMQNGERPAMPEGEMPQGGGMRGTKAGMQDGEAPLRPDGEMSRGGGRSDDGQVYINITGGKVTVYGGADCIDANGSITMSGGEIYASSSRYGITGSEAVLDADGTIKFKSGVTFIATGAGTQMSLNNEQNSLYVYESSQQSAGTEIRLSDSTGNVIASYTPDYSFTGIAITAPEISIGETYTLSVGGTETSVTVEAQETTVGTPSAGSFGGGMGGGNRGGRMSFSDVDQSSSYYKAVASMTRIGAMNGTSETTFSPNETLTRAMAVTVLGRLAGAASDNTASGFDDVENDSWYTGYVSWAEDNGIVNGYGNGSFGVNDTITGKQLQLIISRFAKLSGFEFTPDENASDNSLTRGEFVETLYNAVAQAMTDKPVTENQGQKI